MLSHPEQLARLLAACPEAAPAAVLAGDPCYDRLLAARPLRDRYRRAFGVRRGQRLVLLNSTWNPESLFGDGGPADVLPRLLPRLTAGLPADEYRLAAVLHPNIWHGHGPGQLRLWLDRAARAGLTLVDPLHDWRQALLAADLVLGDFGSVTFYAAALGTPVLLGSAALDGLAPDSPVARFVGSAPVLDPDQPLLPQLESALARPVPTAPAALTSSAPGRSAALLRGHCYRLLDLPEPEAPALLDPLPLPAHQPPVRTAPLTVLTWREPDGTLALRRFADLDGEPAEVPAHAHRHLAVHEDTLDPSVLSLADVIHRHGPAGDPRFGSPLEWAAEVLARYVGCALAAWVDTPHSCTVLTRDGLALRLTGTDADPAAWASAVHAARADAAGGPTLRLGLTEHRVTVSALTP
ncbi:hypothetical protein ACFYNO_12640 [Kitasatospora sp. NPDC006697]|uniref:hypothetical protein n=1 Tax=Kitasatospora sp. NPDC006697 TaxID=3364020 RepID=UPI00369029BE